MSAPLVAGALCATPLTVGLVAVTGRAVGDAFVLGLAAASATALVGGAVGLIRWLARLDARLDAMADQAKEQNTRGQEANLRLATLERELDSDNADSAVSKIRNRVDGVGAEVGGVQATLEGHLNGSHEYRETLELALTEKGGEMLEAQADHEARLRKLEGRPTDG